MFINFINIEIINDPSHLKEQRNSSNQREKSSFEHPKISQSNFIILNI